MNTTHDSGSNRREGRSAQPRKARKYVPVACTNCRRSKRKCVRSSENEACVGCLGRSQDCVFERMHTVPSDEVQKRLFQGSTGNTGGTGTTAYGVEVYNAQNYAPTGLAPDYSLPPPGGGWSYADYSYNLHNQVNGYTAMNNTSFVQGNTSFNPGDLSFNSGNTAFATGSTSTGLDNSSTAYPNGQSQPQTSAADGTHPQQPFTWGDEQ